MAPAHPLGFHWMALKLGAYGSALSKLNRLVRYNIVNCVGDWVPGAFEPFTDCVLGIAFAAVAQPRSCCSMGAAAGSGPTSDGRARRGSCRGVATGDQGDGLFIVHSHATEGHAPDLCGAAERVRVAAGFPGSHRWAHLRGGGEFSNSILP